MRPLSLSRVRARNAGGRRAAIGGSRTRRSPRHCRRDAPGPSFDRRPSWRGLKKAAHTAAFRRIGVADAGTCHTRRGRLSRSRRAPKRSRHHGRGADAGAEMQHAPARRGMALMPRHGQGGIRTARQGQLGGGRVREGEQAGTHLKQDLYGAAHVTGSPSFSSLDPVATCAAPLGSILSPAACRSLRVQALSAATN